MSEHLPQPAEHNQLLGNIRELLNQGRKQVAQAVNSAMCNGRMILETN